MNSKAKAQWQGSPKQKADSFKWIKEKKKKNTQKTADKFNQEKRGNKTTGNEKQAGLRIL